MMEIDTKISNFKHEIFLGQGNIGKKLCSTPGEFIGVVDEEDYKQLIHDQFLMPLRTKMFQKTGNTAAKNGTMRYPRWEYTVYADVKLRVICVCGIFWSGGEGSPIERKQELIGLF